MNNNNAWRADLAVFAALTALFMLAYVLGRAVTPFIVALLFAYVLNPAVKALTRRGAPKAAAVAVFVVFFFMVISAAVVGAAYILKREIAVLADNMPGYVSAIETRYLPALRERLNLGGGFDLSQAAGRVRDELMHISPASVSSAFAYAFRLLSGAVNVFLAALDILLIPVLMAYLLMDFDRMKEAALDSLPARHRRHIVDKLREVEAVLRTFVKGQLMVALIMGALYSVGLWMVGVDMPVLVGMCSGLLNLVPYLGTTIGAVVSVALVLLKYQDVLHPALALAVFGVVQAIEGYLITPKVVGDRLGLHPLVIILALLVFGHLLGFVGVLLAVPLAAVLKVFVSGFLRDYKASSLYG